MRPTIRASLLWGVVGGLSFLVLLQGANLLGLERTSIPVAGGVTLIVFVLVTVLTYAIDRRRNASNQSP